MNIRRSELPLALSMFFYFFLVITTFWILKPIKKGLFIEFYKAAGGFELLGPTLTGSQAELIAKVMNMVVAFFAVVVFTQLSRNLRRQQLTFVFSGFCALAFLLFLFVLGEGPGETGVWVFYLFGDLFNTLMVATFFAFLNDSFRPEAAKRNYGLIILGGVTGGAFGSMVVRAVITELAFSDWMWIAFGLSLVIAAVAWFAGREVEKDPPPEDPTPAVEEKSASENPAIEGARLVFSSRYLLAITAMVALYEIVSTILDFQFTATVEELAVGGTSAHFATVFAITNTTALVIQLFLTSFVLQRFGIGVALLIMPVAIMAASTGYLILPILLLGSSLNTVDNALNYSLNQSARETLYTPTSRNEKYKAKAFIDMFVQRFAKALAVGVALGLTVYFDSFSTVRYLSILTIGAVVLWLVAARYAGRRFAEMTGEGR